MQSRGAAERTRARLARRTGYSVQKRRREVERQQKKRDKAERRARLRESSSGAVPVASAADLQSAAFEANPEANRDPGSRAQPARVFVGSLSFEACEEDLRSLFQDYGEVLDVQVIVDQGTGEPRGFAFVTMEGRKHAMKAMRGLAGARLHGRAIKLDLAVEKR